MPIPALIEGAFGALAAYIGIRLVRARRIPVMAEGTTEPTGWIAGACAVVAGAVVTCFGLALVAEALGWVHLGLG